MAGQCSRPMPRPHVSGSSSSGIPPQSRRSRGKFPGPQSRSRVPFPAPLPATANNANYGQRVAQTSPSLPSHGQRAKRKPPQIPQIPQTSPNSPDLPNFPISSPNNPHPNPFNDNALPTQIPKWGKNETIPIQPIPRSPKQLLNHCSATANARSANLPQPRLSHRQRAQRKLPLNNFLRKTHAPAPVFHCSLGRTLVTLPFPDF